MTEESTILIVDDEPHVIAALTRCLDEEPYRILSASGGDEALALLASQRCKVVISDERMPGMGGSDLLGWIRKLYPHTVRILLTGHASVEATMRAVNSGEIYRFFTKPWDETELKLALRCALEKYDLEEENRRLLRTVRRQSEELRFLERSYPGICEIRRDARGVIRIDGELSDRELADIVAACNAVEGCS